LNAKITFVAREEEKSDIDLVLSRTNESRHYCLFLDCLLLSLRMKVINLDAPFGGKMPTPTFQSADLFKGEGKITGRAVLLTPKNAETFSLRSRYRDTEIARRRRPRVPELELFRILSCYTTWLLLRVTCKKIQP